MEIRSEEFQRNDEAQLRAAAPDGARFVPDDGGARIAHAQYRFIASAADLRSALPGGRYTHVMYYGHAVDDGGTLKPLQKITVTELQHVLQGSGVDHLDILGCRSTAFAAQLASAMPKLKVGNLRGKRFDDIEVDLRSMQLTKFTIVPQVVFHFAPPPASR